MDMTSEKQFAIGMVISCKRTACDSDGDVCAHCVQSFIGESIYKHSHFAVSQVTTANNTKQFVVSFIAHCLKPNCAGSAVDQVACCTASADKCEICLRTIVGRSIREIYGFHAKEIVVC